MGKPRDKVPILPSTTRRGTTLNTSVALDSPSVMSKLLTPPQATVTRAGTSAETETVIDDASSVLDESGSLGPFLDTTIARARRMDIPESSFTPTHSPDARASFDEDLEESYVELDDDLLDECLVTKDAIAVRKLIASRTVNYKLSPDAKFAASPLNIKDKDYDFSVDLSYISIVEKEPFCGTENESALHHINELTTLSNLFSDDKKIRTYFVAKVFPFSLKGAAKAWYDNLSPRSIDSPNLLVHAFFQKYFPPSAQQAALQRIFDFSQEEGEKLPASWARFCSLIRAYPKQPLPKNELLDIFYNGLTDESKTYLDSFASCVFRKRTPAEAEELLAKICKNHDDWTIPESTPAPTPPPAPTPTPILKKRGMIELNDEAMKEAKKSLKDKGIKSEDVKNLPPIEELCKPLPHPSIIEVHSLQRFDSRDIPHTKPPDQCLEEFDNYIVKQDNFNKKVQNHLLENSKAINQLHDIVERTANDVKMLNETFSNGSNSN